MTSLVSLMGKKLDPDLKAVAAYRQVGIKTARDWRDSDNMKWHDAISEISMRNAVEVQATSVPFIDVSLPEIPPLRLEEIPLPDLPMPEFSGLDLEDIKFPGES